MIRNVCMLLALLVSGFGYSQTKTLTKEQYRDKTLAMLLGTCGGVVTGYEYLKVHNTPDGYYAPGATVKQPIEPLLGLPDDWFVMLGGTLGGTTRDEFNYFSNFEEGIIYSDDDQHVDFFNQFLLDKYGPSIAFQDIQEGWLYHDLRDFGGTADALHIIKERNLIAPQCGMGEHGNNGNWLPECYIEHETMGAAFPGMPNFSALFTKKFASMSGQADPLLWGQFWSATHAIAYFETDARVVVEKSFGVLPENCRPKQMYEIVKGLHQKHPTDWRAAVRELWKNHARYPFAVGPDKIMLLSDVNNGTAILSILYGENDYMKTLKIISLAGGDGDCSAAAICGMLGIIKGMAGTPQEFKDRIYKNGKGLWINDMRHALHMHNDFQIEWTFDQLTDLYQKNAERMIRAFGGTVSSNGYTINSHEAFLPSVGTSNWDFEQGNLSGWKTWTGGGGSSVWNERQCNANTNACFAATGQHKGTIVTNTNSSEAKLFQTVTGLKPGATYIVEGRIHTASDREARLYVENYGGPYKYTSIFKGLAAFPIRHMYVTMDPTNTSMDIGLHAPPTGNASKWCSIDDVVITEVVDPSTPVRYEAENALHNGMIHDKSNVSGGKYIGALFNENSFIEFHDVVADYSGEYLIRINYANGENARSQQDIIINGNNLGVVEYPDTGPWGSFSDNIKEAYVRLEKGKNTVRLERRSLNVEIDYIEVISPYQYGEKPDDDAELFSGGIYKIIARHSQKVMDVNGNIENGSQIIQNTFTGAVSQYFKIDHRGGGLYSIMPLNSLKGVEVLGAGMNNGANAGLWNYWGGENQRWAILNAGGGYFKILNAKSGKALDVSGNSNADGAFVFQWDYLNGNNQKWRFDFVGTSQDALPFYVPGKIEAEKFHTFSGVENQATTDIGGGENLAFIDNGDWVAYNVFANKSGKYKVNVRVASAAAGGKIRIKSNNTLLGEIAASNTGGWQNWKTLSTEVMIPEGLQVLRLDFSGATGGLFNVNWIEALPFMDCNQTEFGTADYDACGTCAGGNTGIVPVTDPFDCVITSTTASENDQEIHFYPNPFQESIFIDLPEAANIQIMSMDGKIIVEKYLEESQPVHLNAAPGVYLLKVMRDQHVQVYSLVKH